MFGQKAKISVSQIVMLISISRIFTIMTHAQTFGEQSQPVVKMFGALLSIILLLILTIPVLSLYKKYNNVNALDIVYKKSIICGKLLTIAFLYVTVTTMITGVIGFEYFISNAIYPQSSATVIIISLTVVCLICSSYGLQATARAGVFIFTIFILVFIFVFTTSIGSINLLNIKPIIDNPIEQVLDYSFNFATRGRGLIILMLLYPNIKGTPVKATIITVVFTGLVATLMNFLVAGVLGEYGSIQTFPYFALNSVIEIPILQRLDAMHMMTWALMSFIHFSVFGCVSINLIKALLPVKLDRVSPKFKEIFSIILLLFVILSVSLYMTYTGSIVLQDSIESGILVFLLLFVLPLILLILPKSELAQKN